MTTRTTGHRFPIGSTVRLSPELRAGWHDGRAASGNPGPDLGIGRIVAHLDPEAGYCGSCDYVRDCDGPFYMANFPIFDADGMWAEHEMEAA